ncbi:MAG: hypothetical protein ACKOQ7_08745, partial [Actinomycetota bacterium]
MSVHLIDGTYELYRQHFGQVNRHRTPPPLAATRGVLSSTLQLLTSGATHVTVSMDHVIESFRNQLWDGYKTSEGMEPEILEQIPLVQDALRALGVPVWSMVRYEADDGIAAGAEIAKADPRIEQVQMLTPDTDLGQCVEGDLVVQFDRRNDLIVNERAIRETGESVGGVTDESEPVRDARRRHPEFLPDGALVHDQIVATVELHHEITLDTLAEIRVGRQHLNLLDARIGLGDL